MGTSAPRAPDKSLRAQIGDDRARRRAVAGFRAVVDEMCPGPGFHPNGGDSAPVVHPRVFATYRGNCRPGPPQRKPERAAHLERTTGLEPATLTLANVMGTVRALRPLDAFRESARCIPWSPLRSARLVERVQQWTNSANLLGAPGCAAPQSPDLATRAVTRRAGALVSRRCGFGSRCRRCSAPDRHSAALPHEPDIVGLPTCDLGLSRTASSCEEPHGAAGRDRCWRHCRR